jgi:hypothetical protein
MGNGNGNHSKGPKDPSEVLDGGEQRLVDLPDLGEIVQEPEILTEPYPCQEKDPLFCDAPCLEESPLYIGPVVEAQNSHGYVKGAVPEWEALGPGLYYRWAAPGPL